jgi:WS/DGAT/MGAT family acyltransferase
MSKLTPIDLAFLLLENPSRQVHMAAYQLFRIPARQRKTFVPKLLETYRSGEVGKPFNQKLKWSGTGMPSWETVEPDLRYHVRHIAVPAPGRMEDFYEMVSFLNTSLLDRARPLWECYVIEGLENDQFAVLVKVHHSLIDGGGALKLFDQSLNTSAADKSIRAFWTPFEEPPRRKRSRKEDSSQIQKLMSRVGKLPASLLGASLSLADLGAQNLRLKPQKSSLPFGAKRTPFNNTPESSERRYANCEIPLDQVKKISKATGTTVNDVVMTVIDDALNHYLVEHKAPAKEPLVTMMAMSFRSEEHGATGNQVSVELVPLGEPEANIKTRLQQIHDSTNQIKENSSAIPTAVRQLYSLVIFGSGTLPEFSTAFQSIPNANLLISNMIGPRKQLYLGGAPLVAFHGLPIVPPGCGLNVTFATVNQDICLAVGAAPEAMDEPYRLTQLVLAAVDRLEKACLPRAKTKAKAKSGTRAGKKPAARKRATGGSRKTS